MPAAKGRARAGQRGQTLVEFALTIPILMLLCVGMLDIGWGVYYYNTISNAAREGARFGIVLTDPYYNTYYDRSPWYAQSPWDVPGNEPDVGPYTASAYAGTTTIVGKVAAQALAMDLSKMKVEIHVLPYGTQAHIRLPLTVTVEMPYRPLISNLLGSGAITLRASSMMRTQ